MTDRPIDDARKRDDPRRWDQPRKWLVEWPPRLTPLADLICFPGAGAGASVFRPWVASLPSFAAVAACQLPGREERIDEAAVSSLCAAADTIAQARLSSARRGRPLVLFGHSMGAVLAFETACRLERLGHPPSAVVLAATTPPGGAPAGQTVPGDYALRRLLLAYGAENAALVSNAQLFEAVAPILRADLAMLRRHCIAPTARSGVPAWLLAGETDAAISPAQVGCWADHFVTEPVIRIVPGGHFFPFVAGRGTVLSLLSDLLREAAVRNTAGQVRFRLSNDSLSQ